MCTSPRPSRTRGRPGALNYAITGMGSSPHLAAELFKSMSRMGKVIRDAGIRED